MKKLRQLREHAGLSQEALAKMLKTTQQTIGRWESGKAEPNLAALRDLAMIFATSVDELIEFSKGAKTITTSNMSFGEKTHDGFWGHIGLLLPGETKSKWYPISLSEVKYIDRASSNDAPWILVDTLNNKRLLINRSEIARICLLDEACDEPAGDWELTIEDYHGAPQEIYNCLEEFVYNKDEFVADASEAFVGTLDDFVKEHGLDENNYPDRQLSTRIFSRNWDLCKAEIDRSDLITICLDIELADVATDLPLRISFESTDGMSSSFLTRDICLIEVPLHECLEAAKAVNEEMAGSSAVLEAA